MGDETKEVVDKPNDVVIDGTTSTVGGDSPEVVEPTEPVEPVEPTEGN